MYVKHFPSFTVFAKPPSLAGLPLFDASCFKFFISKDKNHRVQ